ncbi:long-chain fatty acid--CoA ligase [Rhodopseudomonas palustris]|uniref:Long-chain fatty acid--CoA ligase n=1 Tax=Rhodopseudomonas palustris TaxID=1076 RepID=A0A418V127_RHOPL|nr:long-chain fatty acid--CoA ligase [Rhodopseudomonas palustris]RJF69525.1 long-chain fatty acid--CoA ligase [Rhodopseudomonas palustris]
MPHNKRLLKTWPPRLPTAVEPPATSLWDNLAVSAARYPHRTALGFLGSSLTYQQLKHSAERLAARLNALGVGAGDRVLVVMQNCPQLVIAHLAIARANAVTVPVNPMNRAEELRHYITDAQAKVALTTGDLAEGLAAASNGIDGGDRLQHLIVSQFTDVLGDDASIPPPWRDWLTTQHALPNLRGAAVHAWRDAVAADDPLPELRVGRDDLALLPYTSGTTGLPKGCMLTHGSVTHNAMTTMFWIDGTPETVSLGVLPMFHITGLVCVMHGAIYAGATLIIMPRWDRDVAGRLISQHRVSHWLSIPTMIIDLLASPNLDQYDLSSLVQIGGGGAAMPQAVAERLRERFGLEFVEGYGLTETSAVTLMNPCDAPKLQCLGIPFISVDARIIDIETGQEIADGEQGEIAVHGPQVFQGYWQRPDATEQAFIEIDGKRFLRTGDLGYRDADGYFFITDRLKRMINAAGYKVWPAELEALMFRHPGIQEVCIISSTDAYRGETVKAVVVRRPSHADLTEQDIIAWCRTQVSAYKVPRIVEFKEALPKSASGKVMWRALQDAEAAIR